MDGKTVPSSVTTILGKFHSHFDGAAAIKKMRQGRCWPTKRLEFLTPEGREMTDDEILQKWENSKVVASNRGTLMHYQIEMYINGATVDDPWSPEFKQFLDFYAREMEPYGLEPFRTEATLFHCGLNVAGQADFLARVRGSDGDLVLFDWKRSKEIRFQNAFEQMKEPVAHFSDCNFHRYALQLNMYRYILQTEYGYNVVRMVLGVFHPEPVGRAPEPLTVPIPVLDTETEAIVRALGGEAPRPGADALFEYASRKS